MEDNHFLQEQNHIYHMDCLEVLQKIPPQSVDLIIADPPYFRVKGEFDFSFQTVEDYLGWCSSWVAECYRVLKPSGAFYCWGLCQIIDRLSVEVLSKFGWIKRNLIVWNYATGRPGKATYRHESEFLWFYSNPQHKINHDAIRIPYHVGWEKDKRKNPKGKTCGDVWEFARIPHNSREATGHPTQKPEKLVERIILASSKPGDLVLVPFAGSGTELVVCIKNNRRFVASEIDGSYIQKIMLPRIQSLSVPPYGGMAIMEGDVKSAVCSGPEGPHKSQNEGCL